MTPTDTDCPATDKERVLVTLLLRIWDPIGVQPGVHAPANEYDSYVQGVLSIIHSDGDAAALAAFLEDVRTVRMGLGASTRRDQAMAIAILAAVELLGHRSPSPGPAPASSDPLPTARQRELLCDMIHAAFVEVRVLGQAGLAEQAADLADAFHNIPKEMYGWGGFTWAGFRGMLARYQRKWRGSDWVSGPDYLAMLDQVQREG